ncbi:hypothetical protein IJ732_02150 [bacterium]|nr:hypothetical protein [bacterium]
MQISAINSVSKANAYSKLSETKNRYYSPVNMTSKDVFTRSTGNVAPMPVFKQNAKEIQVISFGAMRPTPEIIKPALQMRVQGVRHLQHNMDPELMKQGVFSINKLAESAWKDGEKLTFKLGRGIDLMSRFGKIGRVPDEISKIIMPVVKRSPKDFQFQLSNVIAGNTKGASTIGLRVNLLYNGKDKKVAQQAQDAFDEVLNDADASKKAFFYQEPTSPRDLLTKILAFEKVENGDIAAKRMEKAVDAIVKEIDDPKNKKILLVGHCKPDGDTLGCIMGMKNAIDLVHGDKEVECAVDDDVTGLFRHKLPGIDYDIKHPYSQEKVNLLETALKSAQEKGESDSTIKSLQLSLEKAKNPELLLNNDKKYDLVILMDIPSPARFSGGFKNHIENANKVVYIDHHPFKQEEWDKAAERTGVHMTDIVNSGLAWVAERVPAACEQAGILASKLMPEKNPLSPDNTIKTMNGNVQNKSKLDAAVAAFVTGIWTDTGGFGRTANLLPEDVIDKKGNRVPVQQRPNFYPEGFSKWLFKMSNDTINKKWMRDNITYDINDKKVGEIEQSARERMVEIAENGKYENKDLGFGVVNATYDQMQEVLKMARTHEPETSFLDVQNAFKYSEVMGQFRGETMLSDMKELSGEKEVVGPYDNDKIAVFICESEKAGELNTEGKRSQNNALRFSFRSQEGTIHAELLASLFNGGGHGGAAGGAIVGKDVTLDTKFAVKANGKPVTDNKALYDILMQNYEVMHNKEYTAADRNAKKIKLELVQDESGRNSAKIIEDLVRQCRMAA